MPRNYVKKTSEEGGRRSYKNSDAMIQAYDAVKQAQLSIRQAAKVYGVSYHSLLRRVNDVCPLTAAVGQSTLLSEKEEKDMAEGILLCEEWGWFLKNKDIITLVHNYLEEKGRGQGTLGADWLDGFLKRHKEIVGRQSERRSLTEGVRRKWIDCLKSTFEKYQITRPDQIHNCEEIGMAIDPSVGFVLVKKSPGVFTSVGGPGGEPISVLGCCSAAGKIWPPFVIYKAKRMNVLWTEGGHPRATYTVTDSGRMESKPFVSWFNKDFIPKVKNVPGNKVLIYAGHNSHLSIELIGAAIQNNIILFRLPIHSSDVLPPLDIAVFGHLKAEWREILDDWQCSHRLEKINKLAFPLLINRCWIRGFKAPNVIRGFRTSGIWPFSQDVLEKPVFVRSEPFIESAGSPADKPLTIESDPLKDISNTVVNHQPINANVGEASTSADCGVATEGLGELYNTSSCEELAMASPVESLPKGKKYSRNRRTTSSKSRSSSSMKDACLEFFGTTSPPMKKKRKNAEIQLFQYGECVTDSDLLKDCINKKQMKVEKSKSKEASKASEKHIKNSAYQKLESVESSDHETLPLPELCEVCITDDEGVWVACNKCKKWFHVKCACLGNINEIQAAEADFTCYKC